MICDIEDKSGHYIKEMELISGDHTTIQCDLYSKRCLSRLEIEIAQIFSPLLIDYRLSGKSEENS